MDENIIFPRFLLDYFSTEALKNCKVDQIETLAIALGKKTANVIEIQELVFPEQKGNQNSVKPAGKIEIAYNVIEY